MEQGNAPHRREIKVAKADDVQRAAFVNYFSQYCRSRGKVVGFTQLLREVRGAKPK